MWRSILISGLLALSGPATAGDAGPVGPQSTGRLATSDGYVRPPAKPGHSYPECYCTGSKGERVEVGDLACLTIGSRQMTSRCEKVRNLVIWRHQSEGCTPGV